MGITGILGKRTFLLFSCILFLIFYSTGARPYVVDPGDSESYWYNMTLYETELYYFNVNFNPDIEQY
jgi:hypothetical protein